MEYIEVEAKTVDDAITDALVELGVTSDQIEYEVLEKGTTGFLGRGGKQAKIRVHKKEEGESISAEEEIRAFLGNVYDAMGLEVEIAVAPDEEEENVYAVEMTGPEMGVLIGKRGQTLDALQYLTNLAVNRKTDTYVRIKLDTEDYRNRRKATLENLAKNVAYKVKRTQNEVELEPMNPYERRVIHFALQNDRYVTTHSEGEGHERHVVVTPKEGAPEYRDRRDQHGSGGYRGSRKYEDYREREDSREPEETGENKEESNE